MKDEELKNTESNNLPSVVAVVLTTNEAKDAEKCVRSLLAANYSNLRIIVVDNASTDSGPEILHRQFPDIQIIVRSTNGGYAAGNNTGISAALEQDADYVLVSNSDIIVEKDFLKPMVSIAEQQMSVGLVVGTARYQSHPEQLYYAAGKFSRLLCTGMNTTRKSKILARGEKEVDVDFVNGAAFLARRKVFEELGLLDEKFFLYFDDLEFSRRYGSRFRLVYTPKSVAYHKSGGGKGWRNYTENYLYYHTRNRFWVFHNEVLLYRMYVAVYAVLNAVAKSVIISTNILNDSQKTMMQLCALWRGIRDGLLMKVPS